MKNIAVFLAALTLSASASLAFGESISIASNNTTVKYQGFVAQPAGPYAADPLLAGDAKTVSLNQATFNITTGGGIWTAPIAGSNYVSFDNNSQPGGTVDPNGYYTYSSQFNAVDGGSYSETLSLLADDTVAVYLNGVKQVSAGAIGSDGHCSDNQPNCTTIFTQSFNAALNPGLNTLLFVVEQTGLSAQGLDFTASFNNATPEPNSLILLGSGLVSGAGMLLRRRRSIA